MTDLFDLSAPALAVQRATEAGSGVLSKGRSWVQYEGWVLKEGGITGGWNLRYFVATGDRLEYFKEEKVSVSRPGEKPGALLVSLGLSLDCTNVVCAAPGVAQPKDRPLLHEGDVVIGINGEPVVNRPAQAVLESVPAGSVAFTLLRPRGRVALHGASVVSVGPRKHGGGHVLSVSVSDPNARRSRYTLVCADERVCAAWVGSIKEAIAASAMEEIKNALSQALQYQALQSDAPQAQRLQQSSGPADAARRRRAPPAGTPSCSSMEATPAPT